MTDKKISQLTNITGSNVDDANDELAIVDASSNETKAITRAELMSSVAAIDVSGNVTVGGTVDGRDVASDGSKLDGIESGADVTDTANVTAAGALMDSELTSEAAVKALDQGVATTDEPTFTNTQLAEIAETKADTAVDVFVYDTSKDSDGGAWRHRTQHTSWYNETLNTTTRGARREFPAVAVIVAESNKVTIYDGDDPALPMWMVFNRGATSYFLSTSQTVTSVSMQNGVFVWGTSSTGIRVANFVGDFGLFIRPTNDDVFSNISTRNTDAVITPVGTNYLVDGAVNDVAMTVLPDAPIDPATGLPVPTIAVATGGGVSVIKDDGTVVDSQFNQATSSVDWSDDGVLWLNRANTQAYYYATDFSVDPFVRSGFDHTSQPAIVPSQSDSTVITDVLDNVAASGFGVSRLDLNKSTPASSMVAYTTSTYNTGYQNGDIKGAFLADTDDTDLVGSGELVTNGTFDTDLSGWIDRSNGDCSVVYDSGAALFNQGSVGKPQLAQQLSNSANSFVSISYDLSNENAELDIANNTDGNFLSRIAGSQNQVILYLESANAEIEFSALDDGETLDNVSVKLADADRSVNNNGLIVNGTVTRSPVATGADLVAYSGFSTSNYLEQPYNPDLDFGTGDFCVMGWVKGSGSDGILIMRDSAPTGENFFLRLLSGELQCRIDDGSTSKIFSGGSGLNSNNWVFVSLVKSGDNAYIYVNGSLEHTEDVSAVGSLDNADAVLTIGNNTGTSNAWGGSLALWRISATVPTAEQIAKIYNDEKFLFQENAQATLYGTSDAVTALAHDPVTDLLHVGTSAGRSVFQGLRRVENTTDAVGTAISASNNLIVEQ